MKPSRFLFAATESAVANLLGCRFPGHAPYNSDGPRMTVPMIRAKVVNIAAITVTIQPVVVASATIGSHDPI